MLKMKFKWMTALGVLAAVGAVARTLNTATTPHARAAKPWGMIFGRIGCETSSVAEERPLIDRSELMSEFPPVSIDDRAVQVVEGTAAGGTRVKLFFDKESGLLTRQTRFIDTKVGLIPLHIDYSDYRAVSGVKMPFHWTVTWVDGQSTTELTDVQANAAVAAARFVKPSATTSRGPAPK